MAIFLIQPLRGIQTDRSYRFLFQVKGSPSEKYAETMQKQVKTGENTIFSVLASNFCYLSQIIGLDNPY